MLGEWIINGINALLNNDPWGRGGVGSHFGNLQPGLRTLVIHHPTFIQGRVCQQNNAECDSSPPIVQKVALWLMGTRWVWRWCYSICIISNIYHFPFISCCGSQVECTNKSITALWHNSVLVSKMWFSVCVSFTCMNKICLTWINAGRRRQRTLLAAPWVGLHSVSGQRLRLKETYGVCQWCRQVGL